jgi:hypothetical protein
VLSAVHVDHGKEKASHARVGTDYNEKLAVEHMPMPRNQVREREGAAAPFTAQLRTQPSAGPCACILPACLRALALLHLGWALG